MSGVERTAVETRLPLRLRVEHALKESGLCIDQVWVLRLVLGGGMLAKAALRFLRLRFSPLLLDSVRALPLPLAERAELFTLAISRINARETYKTTGRGRTRLVDAAVLRRADDFRELRVLEVGVSDGVSSLDLVAALPAGTEVVLSDRHPNFTARGVWPVRVILDGSGRILGLKLFCLYLNLPLALSMDPGKGRRIDTANPLLSEANPPRPIARFDVLSDAFPRPFRIIKCANVFNRKYFADGTIRAAVANLSRSLDEDGYLFVSQNNDRYAERESYFALQKRGGCMRLVEERNGHEALELFREDT